MYTSAYTRVSTVIVYNALFPASYDKVPSKADNIDQLVKRILSHAEALLPKVEDVKAEQMGDMVDQEMQQTTEAIAQAAEKIAVCNII